MTSWWWVLAACGAAYAVKASGYLIPATVLGSPTVLRLAGFVTIGLLAGLIAANAVADGQHLHADARLVALGAAVVALLLRAPFIVVVLAGAVAAALARLVGLA